MDTSFSRIKNFASQFQVIGNLKLGERLYHKNGKITRIYEAAYGKRGFRFFLSSIKQSIHRWTHCQSTGQGLSNLRKSLEAARQEIDSIAVSQELATANSTLRQLISMKEALQKEGWSSLEKTSVAGLNHLFPISKKEHDARQSQMNALNEIRAELIRLINLKADAIADSHSPEKEKEQITSLVFQAMNSAAEPFPVDGEPIFSTNQVQDVLESLFGKEATQESLKSTRLIAQPLVSMNDVQALVVGIAANLTRTDIQSVLQSSAWNRCPHAPLKEAIDKARGKELNDSILYPLLLQLRDVQLPPDHLFLSPKHKALEAIDSVVFIVPKRPVVSSLHVEQYQVDIEKIRACRRVSAYAEYDGDSKLKKVNFSEYLARDIIYAYSTSTRDQILIPLFDASRKNDRHHTCKELRSVIAKEGLHCMIASPLFPQNEEQAIPVDVLFRGTYDVESGLRDFSPKERVGKSRMEGPGAKTWYKYEETMLKKVLGELQRIEQQTGRPALLRIEGHSLGATDAMRFANAWTMKYAAKEQVLPALQKVELYAFNPPRLEHKPLKEFLQACKKLPAISFQLHYFKAHGDIVQLGGTALVGAHDGKGKRKYWGKKPAHILTTVFHFRHRHVENDYFYRLRTHTEYMMADSQEERETYLAHVATNDPEWAGTRIGRTGARMAERDDRIAQQALEVGRFKYDDPISDFFHG